MKKLLVILLLFFPVHGAWAEKADWLKATPEEMEEMKKEAEARKRRLGIEENKSWLDKIKEKNEERKFEEHMCALSAEDAKTDAAAKQIFKSCMKNKGLGF